MQDHDPTSDPVPSNDDLTESRPTEPGAAPLRGLFSTDSPWAEEPSPPEASAAAPSRGLFSSDPEPSTPDAFPPEPSAEEPLGNSPLFTAPEEPADSVDSVKIAPAPISGNFEERIRTVFRILTMTSLFVIIGLCILCRDRIGTLMGRPPSDGGQVQTAALDDPTDPEATTDSAFPSDQADSTANPSDAATPATATTPVGSKPVKNGRGASGKAPRDGAADEVVPEVDLTPETIPDTLQPVDLRFLGIRVTGSRFVFVLDGSTAMGEAADSPLALAKKEVRRSLNDLGPGNRFQILVSGEQSFTARLSEGNRLAPATRANRNEASRFLDQVAVGGDANLGETLLDALRLKPDAVLVISDVHTPPLAEEDLAFARRVSAGQVAVHVVEIGDEIEPPEHTALRTLARENKGQYFYVHGAPHRIVHRTTRPKGAAPPVARRPPSDPVAVTPVVAPTDVTPDGSAAVPPPSAVAVADDAGDVGWEKDFADTPGVAALPADGGITDEDMTEKPDEAETASTVQRRPRPVKDKPKKFNVPKAQQTEIEALMRTVYNNAGETDFFRPALLAQASDQILGTVPTVVGGAKAGFPPAEYLVGLFYFNGIRTTADPEKAVDCFLRGAQDEFTPAMTMLALCYLSGRGIHTDQAEGAYWCNEAAERGDPLAMLAMSQHFSDNDATRLLWLRKSAAKGLPEAMFKIGELYEQGTAVKKSEAEAVTWYRRGAEKGSEKSREALRRLRK